MPRWSQLDYLKEGYRDLPREHRESSTYTTFDGETYKVYVLTVGRVEWFAMTYWEQTAGQPASPGGLMHDPLYLRLGNDVAAQTVLGHLGRGKDVSVSIGVLSERLSWTRRMVEKSVQALRLDGFPICSDGDGIWLGDLADVEATLRSLRGRMVNQYGTYLALRKTARRLRSVQVDQLPLFFDVA